MFMDMKREGYGGGERRGCFSSVLQVFFSFFPLFPPLPLLYSPFLFYTRFLGICMVVVVVDIPAQAATC